MPSFVDGPAGPFYPYVRKTERTMTSALLTEPRSQIDDPSSPVERFSASEPLAMDSGIALAPWQIAYQTYGTLNADRTNAVLICHALTGDQHVASPSPVTGKPGWWETMVGPGRPVGRRCDVGGRCRLPAAN